MNIKGNHKSYVAQAEAELNSECLGCLNPNYKPSYIKRKSKKKDRYWFGFVAGAVVGAFIMFVIAGNLYLMSVGV